MSEFNIEESKLIKYILDSIEHPIVFVDTNFIIRYLNKVAEKEYYVRRKMKSIIGKPLFKCHPPYAIPTLEKAFKELENGEDEVYLYFNKKINIDLYMRAVKDEDGNLIGFFQRFDKPYNPVDHMPKREDKVERNLS